MTAMTKVMMEAEEILDKGHMVETEEVIFIQRQTQRFQ